MTVEATRLCVLAVPAPYVPSGGDLGLTVSS